MEIIPGVYQHYKGGMYRVLFLARDQETNGFQVIYVPLHDSGEISSRSLVEFSKRFRPHMEQYNGNQSNTI